MINMEKNVWPRYCRFRPPQTTLGLVQTSNFSCAESNANELSSLFQLICIRFGT